MVSPRNAMESVAKAVANSDKLPAEMGVTLREADMDSDDADVDMPLLEIQPVEVDNVVVHNTDFVGYVTDNAGNHVGRVYHSEYEMTISLDIWTIADSEYDPDSLGRRLREALYPYASHGPQNDFVDENGNPLDDITYFRLDTGERADDLIQTPTVRRWSQQVELWGYEEFSTEEDYITEVSYPDWHDLNDDDNDGMIENT